MDLAENLEKIRQKMARAAERCSRSPEEIQLLAVTKGHPPETIKAAAELGLTHFGESKVQEAKAKIPLCPGRLRWQMIGHLQSNKCRDAIHFFELIQSVDSLALAEELNKEAQKVGKVVPILLEVNVAGEASKFGYRPDALMEELARLNELKKLEIHGLMSIPPWKPEPEMARPYFQSLRELKLRCEDLLGAPLSHLSMGMSGDFEVAIEEGSTMVRIGTALFGERPKLSVRKGTEP
jgi:PLP dependent protein